MIRLHLIRLHLIRHGRPLVDATVAVTAGVLTGSPVTD